MGCRSVQPIRNSRTWRLSFGRKQISLITMSALATTAVVPLVTDSHGGIRVRGTRVALDRIVVAFKSGATAEERQTIERAALREFKLLETLRSPSTTWPGYDQTSRRKVSWISLNARTFLKRIDGPSIRVCSSGKTRSSSPIFADSIGECSIRLGHGPAGIGTQTKTWVFRSTKS